MQLWKLLEAYCGGMELLVFYPSQAFLSILRAPLKPIQVALHSDGLTSTHLCWKQDHNSQRAFGFNKQEVPLWVTHPIGTLWKMESFVKTLRNTFRTIRNTYPLEPFSNPFQWFGQTGLNWHMIYWDLLGSQNFCRTLWSLTLHNIF